jgi:hypothetical protein
MERYVGNRAGKLAVDASDYFWKLHEQIKPNRHSISGILRLKREDWAGKDLPEDSRKAACHITLKS